MKKGVIQQILFNKQSNEARMFNREWNEFLVKEKGVNLRFVPHFGCQDSDGIYHSLYNLTLERFISSAKAGILSPDLDKLEEIKNLDTDANPIIFYYEFKD